LGAPQSFSVQGKDYRIYLRPRRHYYPFTMTLKEFHHDIYPGTDIPKNFSSRVRLTDPAKGETRDALIYMNHPLRYAGKTFYQASFGKGDTLSVFQVVENPASWAPYISCALIVLGLAIQFLSHLFEFVRKRS
jgi:cytochrome c biogenesis protein ResB